MMLLQHANFLQYPHNRHTLARPYGSDIEQAGKQALTNASENLAGRVENRPGRVEFCIG